MVIPSSLNLRAKAQCLYQSVALARIVPSELTVNNRRPPVRATGGPSCFRQPPDAVVSIAREAKASAKGLNSRGGAKSSTQWRAWDQKPNWTQSANGQGAMASGAQPWTQKES